MVDYILLFSFYFVISGLQFISVCEYFCTILDYYLPSYRLNPSNAELNPICHLLGLLVAHHILHVSRIRVNYVFWKEM
jgi:hypothetical protein